MNSRHTLLRLTAALKAAVGLCFVALMLNACNSGSSSQSSSDITESSVEDGDSQVTVDQDFTVTFAYPVDTDTVTNDSFFIMLDPNQEDARSTLTLDASSSIDVCDPTQALEALIQCTNDLNCILSTTTFLDYSTRYIICLMSSIRFQEPAHVFDGSSIGFTTADPSEFTIGGTVTGLDGTLVLQNNGGNDLTLTADGSFTFSQTVTSTYNVTIATEPDGQDCVLSNASGTAVTNVTNVTVVCSTTASAHFLFPSDEAVAANFGASVDARTQANSVCQSSKTHSFSSLTCAGGVAALISISDADQLKDLPTKYDFSLTLPIETTTTGNTQIASNWTDLLDGTITSRASDVTWWSGSNEDGSASGFDCEHWTTANGLSGGIGDAAATDWLWIEDSSGLCNDSYHLLCICYQQ